MSSPNSTAITSIVARIATAPDDDDYATAKGSNMVFLGAAGREFRANRDDISTFEPESDNEYIFGEGANVTYPDQNDPRSTNLTLEHLNRNDVYIRYQTGNDSNESWRVERIDVTVTAANGSRVSYGVLAGRYKQWLGNEVGLKLSLNRR
ncbi:hypothetical protein SAMN05444920_13335 [Nonomuraea solani]|uniref:PLAT/LH2 domain-containing protein n=1 Tax=Nonomuraea solani TaxID=1144553 RepID=A0A1H6F193_9ACTN|nr:hypothetical protein [Nonomuraea solani]SEH03131.1 hypothetical protein SAMN05444920_13335 [Nonomuraea solani]